VEENGVTRWRFLIVILLSTILCCAQASEKRPPDELNLTSEPYTIPLWEHGTRVALGNELRDISFTAPYAHAASGSNLLGENPSLAMREELSTDGDRLVPPENSVSFYLALQKVGIPAELHIFEKGRHGVGLALANPVLAEWPTLLSNWLRDRGLREKR
jgi:acetyl esterase/lipase